MPTKETLKTVKSLLEKVQSTVDNTGQWSGNYTSVNFWIGDKGGSRVGQYEAIVKLGVAYEVRAKTYSALVKKMLKVIESLPIS